MIFSLPVKNGQIRFLLYMLSLFIYSFEWAFQRPQKNNGMRAAHFNVILNHAYFLKNIEKQQQALPSLCADNFYGSYRIILFH